MPFVYFAGSKIAYIIKLNIIFLVLKFSFPKDKNSSEKLLICLVAIIFLFWIVQINLNLWFQSFIFKESYDFPLTFPF